jgi:outer membrane lipoprotein SlyB
MSLSTYKLATVLASRSKFAAHTPASEAFWKEIQQNMVTDALRRQSNINADMGTNLARGAPLGLLGTVPFANIVGGALIDKYHTPDKTDVDKVLNRSVGDAMIDSIPMHVGGTIGGAGLGALAGGLVSNWRPETMGIVAGAGAAGGLTGSLLGNWLAARTIANADKRQKAKARATVLARKG